MNNNTKILSSREYHVLSPKDLEYLLDRIDTMYGATSRHSLDICHDRDFPLVIQALKDIGLLPKKAQITADPSPGIAMVQFPEDRHGFRILELVHGPISRKIKDQRSFFTVSSQDIVFTLILQRKRMHIPKGNYVSIFLRKGPSGRAQVQFIVASDTYPIQWRTIEGK